MWRLMQNDAYTALVDLEHLHNMIVLFLLWMVKKDFETTKAGTSYKLAFASHYKRFWEKLRD